MMRQGLIRALLPLLLTVSAAAAAPRLTGSEPQSGAQNVSCEIGVLRFSFDRDMKPGGWSLLESEQGVFPPMVENDAAQWIDRRNFQLRVSTLQPATTYAVQLNSPELASIEKAPPASSVSA